MRSTKHENLGTELAKLTDPERRAASERFRVIWPFLEAGVPLKRIAEEQGKSLRTLRAGALLRYQQFYSRIGFLHRYKPLDITRVREVLKNPSVFGVDLGAEELSEEAVAGMIRYPEGNFRTLEKLTQRVESILEINGSTKADAEVVQLARQQILLGPS